MLSAQAAKTSKKRVEITDESQYITALLTGDEAVVRLIYDKFLPPVVTLVTRQGGRRADALDVFQDALMIVHDKAQRQGTVLTGTFFSYLYGICRRVYGNKLQKKDNQTVTTDNLVKLSVNDDIQPFLENQEREKAFWDAFKKLGADCQKLLLLFFEGRSMEEICEAMGHGSVGYAKKRKFQCKETLVAHVKSDPRYAELARESTVNR